VSGSQALAAGARWLGRKAVAGGVTGNDKTSRWPCRGESGDGRAGGGRKSGSDLGTWLPVLAVCELAGGRWEVGC
jgi:hypothetical protein